MCTSCYNKRNSEKIAEYQRKYRAELPEDKKDELLRKRKTKYQANIGKNRAALRNWANTKYRNMSKEEYARYLKRVGAFRRGRRQRDINFRIACNLRTRLCNTIRRGDKKVSAISDLGCSFEQFISHLENQFLPGMSWGNYGKQLGEWSVDHIDPLKGEGVDLTDIETQKRLCHYTNLRPMWHIDNIKKSNKMEK